MRGPQEGGLTGSSRERAGRRRYDTTRPPTLPPVAARPACEEDVARVPARQTPGRSLVTRRAITDVVRAATLGSYGVTGLAGGPLARLLARADLAHPGIAVHVGDGLDVELDLEVALGVPVAEVARQVGLELALPAVQKGIDLALEADDDDATTIAGQALLLHELVSNLVDNAIRYTPPGGSVLVRVRRRGEAVVLDVQDSGPGLDPAEYDKVFMPFYRAAAALESNPGGTGLGLAIVRDIATVHGATLTLNPADEGRGLKVTVTWVGWTAAPSTR